MGSMIEDENAMRLLGPLDQTITTEFEVLTELLPLDGAHVLDLGCGAADKSLQLAEQTNVASIVAAEVDKRQHQKNLDRGPLPKMSFASFGAEAIPADDASFDIVLMFKSLHHVPLDLLDQALEEIHRVLKLGGVLYVSEPVFAGAFNEIIRLFHDEQHVREAAFAALQRAVKGQHFDLVEERFFCNRVKLDSFAQFDKGIMQATHTEHDVSEELRAMVRDAFESNHSEDGYVFDIPNRVDLLRKR